ncbi:hypothetical protein pzkkv7_56 [Klebsiella phage pzk-kv7]|nr:hypothetical protein pzkkv7_56 [Klebsiella phage pzk-kv7]
MANCRGYYAHRINCLNKFRGLGLLGVDTALAMRESDEFESRILHQTNGDVAKLVAAPGLGLGVEIYVWVRVPPSLPNLMISETYGWRKHCFNRFESWRGFEQPGVVEASSYFNGRATR